MANSDQLARRAYQAYARIITPAGGVSPPPYVDLDGRTQRAWRVAADAIVDALADEHPAVLEEIHAAARRSLAGEP